MENRPNPDAAEVTRRFQFIAGVLGGMSTINGRVFDPDRIDARPRLGSTEVWEISGDPAHPIHLHLVQFQILSRKKLDVGRYEEALEAARGAAGDSPVDANGQLVNPDPTPYIFANAPVGANEMGPKDTVRANPNQVTYIKANFDRVGKYVYHCHILEHEDNDMMRPYDGV